MDGGAVEMATFLATRAPRCFDRRDEAGAAEAPLAGRVVASDPTDRGIAIAMTSCTFLSLHVRCRSNLYGFNYPVGYY